MVCTRYRPHQPRASPVWQILYDHAADVPGLSPEAVTAIEAFLDCGDLHAGFTRLHCPDCGHEYLLAFTENSAGSAPPALGPPVPEVTVLVAADSVPAYPVDFPPFESRLPYPRPRDEAIRYLAGCWVSAVESSLTDSSARRPVSRA